MKYWNDCVRRAGLAGLGVPLALAAGGGSSAAQAEEVERASGGLEKWLSPHDVGKKRCRMYR